MVPRESPYLQRARRSDITDISSILGEGGGNSSNSSSSGQRVADGGKKRERKEVERAEKAGGWQGETRECRGGSRGLLVCRYDLMLYLSLAPLLPPPFV